MILRPSITALGATWSSPRRAEWMLRDEGTTTPEGCQPLPPHLLTISGFPNCDINVSARVTRPDSAGWQGLGTVELYNSSFNLGVLNGTFAWEEPGDDGYLPVPMPEGIFAYDDDGFPGFGCSNVAKVLIHEQEIHGEVTWDDPWPYTSLPSILYVYGYLLFHDPFFPAPPDTVGRFSIVGIVTNARDDFNVTHGWYQRAYFPIARYTVTGDRSNPATWVFTRQNTCSGGGFINGYVDFGPAQEGGGGGWLDNNACLCSIDSSGDGDVETICDLSYITVRVRKFLSTIREHTPYTVDLPVCGADGTECIPAGFDLMRLLYESGASGPNFTQQGDYEDRSINMTLPRAGTRFWQQRYCVGADGIIGVATPALEASAPAVLVVSVSYVGGSLPRYVINFNCEVLGSAGGFCFMTWELRFGPVFSGAPIPEMICEDLPDPRGYDIPGDVMQNSVPVLHRGVWSRVGSAPGGALREWPDGPQNFHAYVINLDFSPFWIL